MLIFSSFIGVGCTDQKHLEEVSLYYMKWEIPDGTTHQLNSSLKSDFNKLGAGVMIELSYVICVWFLFFFL